MSRAKNRQSPLRAVSGTWRLMVWKFNERVLQNSRTRTWTRLKFILSQSVLRAIRPQPIPAGVSMSKRGDDEGANSADSHACVQKTCSRIARYWFLKNCGWVADTIEFIELNLLNASMLGCVVSPRESIDFHVGTKALLWSRSVPHFESPINALFRKFAL